MPIIVQNLITGGCIYLIALILLEMGVEQPWRLILVIVLGAVPAYFISLQPALARYREEKIRRAFRRSKL
ncbi:MAG TPA: hypothetical protein VIL65_01600 [Beijerinckiaceae bacterium]|jgi:uncharacterized membrane protein